MKRAGRWLFNFAAAVSLILCLATVSMWVRSHWRLDSIGWQSEESFSNMRYYRLILRRDELKLTRLVDRIEGAQYPDEPIHRSPAKWWWNTYRSVNDLPAAGAFLWQPEGFRFNSKDSVIQGWRHSSAELSIPYWPLTLIAVAATSMSAMLIRRNKRHARHGLCHACGYDLRVTPDRCPECGAVTESAKGATA